MEIKELDNYDNIFEDDKLNIKPYVIDFAHLIEQEQYVENGCSKVYSISAEFGIGKTFFCNKLKAVLQKDNIKVGKINIWEMDFYKNPLIPLLAEINKLYINDGEKICDKLLKTITNLGQKAFSVVGEITTKAIYDCIIAQISQFDGYANIKNIASDTNLWEICKNTLSSETIFDTYNNHINAINELKNTLKSWSSKQNNPIVIIVDELDRCKPDYAVKTLEILKHFFDIPGFVFVLAIDEEQLKNSVQTLFGCLNYDGYKRKFINNNFIMPSPNRLSFTEFLYEKHNLNDIIKKIYDENRELIFYISIYNIFINSFTYSESSDENKHLLAKEFNNRESSQNIITRYFAAYSDFFNFTPRQMEQVFDRLVIFIKQISYSKEIFSPDLAVFLVCLHEFNIDIYKNIINKKGNVITSCNSKTSLLQNIEDINNSYGQNKLKKFNRTIAPELINISGYSGKKQYDQYNDFGKTNIVPIIKDNIDRFFINDTSLLEHQALDTNNIKLNSIDLNKLKQNYCRHMDFISHFE